MMVVFSEKCLEYFRQGHPESPNRVRESYEFLKQKKCKFIESEVASEKDILAVHSKELVESIKSKDFVELDCPAYENIFYYASLAAGSAIKAAEFVLKTKKHCFSLARPPGHHASRNSLGGFCYFSNIAIAAMKAVKEKKLKKVAIVDIDVHHGNGTQDIFLGDKRVLYVSLHQSPHYPGTGLRNEKNCFNFLLSAGTAEEKYIQVLKKALKKVEEFQPELIAVSAGFDTYEQDPLGDFKLKIESYEKIAKLISNLDVPVFSVLEGGYSACLGECIHSYLNGFC